MTLQSPLANSSAPMIDLSNVSMLYGKVIGVNDLQCQLPSGPYGLIGPNGSGKTTLINLLTGQLRPTIGTVRVFGQDPMENRSVLRRIGLCPATDVLYPNVSAYQWVRYLIRLHGFSTMECHRRAEESLEQVGMKDSMHRQMGGYSLGMRQRAKLAQAIAHDPDLLILDEPYNGLDPVGRHDMTELLKEWSTAGRSLLFASHVLHEIESVTRSFLLIHGGRLLATGTAEEIDTIVAETPQEVAILGPDVGKLVVLLADQPNVTRMEFIVDDHELRIGVRDPLKLVTQLTHWVANMNLSINQFRTADGDLTSMFESLLRRHRGEIE